MLHVSVLTSRDGRSLSLQEGSLARHLVAEAGHELLVRLGHPCCGHGIGRIGWVCDLAFHFMQRVQVVDDGHREELLRISLEDGSPLAEALLGELWEPFDVDDDDELTR